MKVQPIGDTAKLLPLSTKTATVKIGRNLASFQDFVFEHAQTFASLTDLTFRVTLDYSVKCTDNYDNNCPIFSISELESPKYKIAHSDENTKAQVLLNEDQTSWPINLCDDVKCKCDLTTTWGSRKTEIIAGQDDRVGVVVDTLTLTNNGDDIAYNTKITVTGLGDNFFLSDPRCNGQVCTIKTIGKDGANEALPLKIKSRSPVAPNVTSLDLSVTVTADCSETGNSDEVENISIEVAQEWTMEAKAKTPKSEVSWNEGDPSPPHDLALDFTLQNAGPSMADKPNVYVLVPGDSEWVTTNGTRSVVGTDFICTLESKIPAKVQTALPLNVIENDKVK